MKILYIHQYFRTPQEGGAVRSYHIALAMVKAGHSVEMITSHNSPKYEVKNIEGIKVHYLPIPYRNEMGSLRRIWSFINFATQAYWLGKKTDHELIYATSTPLTVGWTALKLKKKKGTPFIFEVRDLWPEIPQKLGVITNKFLLQKAFQLENKIYSEAEKIIALSPSMTKKINPISKVYTIPNFSNNYSNTQTRQTRNNVFKIIYTGALGYVNDIPFLLQLIRLIDQKFESKIQLTFIGAGKFSDTIHEACKTSKYSNYLGFLPQNEVFEHLSNSDAVLTTFLDNPVLESNSPNKFFDGLAHGKVALINFGGWLDELISEENCGKRIDIESTEHVLKELLDNPKLVSTLQSNAKKVALDKFDKDTLCKQIVTLIDQ